VTFPFLNKILKEEFLFDNLSFVWAVLIISFQKSILSEFIKFNEKEFLGFFLFKFSLSKRFGHFIHFQIIFDSIFQLFFVKVNLFYLTLKFQVLILRAKLIRTLRLLRFLFAFLNLERLLVEPDMSSLVKEKTFLQVCLIEKNALIKRKNNS